MIRLAALSGLALLLAGCGRDEAPRASAPTSIHLVMAELVDPSADRIWEAVSTVETAQGATVRHPATDAEWAALRGHADTLLEAARLLRTGMPAVAPGEAVADAEVAGTRTGAQIDADIRADPAAFAAAVDGYEAAARSIRGAIDRRDTAALFAAGEALDGSCDTCHFAYWHPRVPPVEMPSPRDFARHQLR